MEDNLLPDFNSLLNTGPQLAHTRCSINLEVNVCVFMLKYSKYLLKHPTLHHDKIVQFLKKSKSRTVKKKKIPSANQLLFQIWNFSHETECSPLYETLPKDQFNQQ